MAREFLILAPRRRSDPEPERLLLQNLAQYGKITRTSDWVSLFNYASINTYSAIFISCATYAEEHRMWRKEINRLHPHQSIILFSAHTDFDVRVIRETSRIFGILRLSDVEHALDPLIARLDKYLQFRQNLGGKVSKQLLRPGGFGDFVGNSDAMLDVYRQLTRIAASEYTVLIQGESGSGKELVARTIHHLSERREKTFVSINCAAIPENLLESELFGYMKGAFTGAVQNKAGKFELAHKGTLFLDEIGDMPLELQVKLLRVLEDGRIQPLGSVEEKQVDIRLVTATHRDLPDQITRGLFREDLHYRLNVIPLQVPPLRLRSSDIPLLVLYFLEKLLRGEDQTIRRIAWDLLAELEKLDLHGNVRELENLLTRSVFQSEGQQLTGASLLTSGIGPQKQVGQPVHAVESSGAIQPLWQMEKDALQHALETLDGNISQAAAQLQISRTAIYRKIKKYGLDYSQPAAGSRADNA
ncbi:MAG: sigma-54 dependent transcriptional regulator [Candidatus Marinimicrobia bacterium]|nr:sigma-54 dependent transcriptional regulator [Candidatus Neomarinimicrobiota bacterium]